MIILLTGVVGFVLLLVFLMTFFILGQTGGSANPLLRLFGISEEQLYPFLINMANLFFGLFDFIGFLLAVIGVFMLSMAKKEDKVGKKRGAIFLSIGLAIFTVFSMAWAGSYYYLQQKKAEYVQTNVGEVRYIETDPADTTTLSAPATVKFDASKLPVDPNRFTIISYSWNFGDGGVATGPAVSHRYLAKGEEGGRYIVELTVAYRDKKTNEEAEQVFTVDVVFVNEKVSASFTAEPTSGDIPLTVHFDASESADPDGEITAYAWDLDGDGEFDDGTEVEENFTYERYGSYTVSLQVTDNNGETNVAEQEIVVEEGQHPRAEIKVEMEEGDVLNIGKSYLFEAANATSPTGTVSKYSWDFGDGSNPVNSRTAQHTYNKGGVYTIILTLTDDKKETGQVVMEVNVGQAAASPKAVITTDQPWSNDEKNEISGSVPFKVEFSAKQSTDPNDDIVNYRWDFEGDVTLDGAGEELDYTYQTPGIYHARLVLEDAAGNESETSITVVAGAQGLTPDLTADTLSGEVPLTVKFDASGSRYPEGQIVNYRWDFGDGKTRFDKAQVNYTFMNVGKFEVKVTAIASDGTEATDSLFINILPVSLTACFKTNVSSGSAPLVVTFNPACSTGTIQKYKWDFGDGETNTTRKPAHTFSDLGTYQITLTVEDPDGVSDTYESTVIVE